MIHILAQIVFRQVCAPKGRVLDEPDRPPALCSVIEQTACISGADHCTPVASPSMQTSGAVRELGPHTQALVILFTQLAQRRVQAARAQEETYEDGSHQRHPSRADGLRLRPAINSVASP
jgi:hypothetical protein